MGTWRAAILAAGAGSPPSFSNAINLGSKGSVPVAILSELDFAATTVDPATVALAGAGVGIRGKGALMASEEDVDGEGLTDLVVHMETQNLHPEEVQGGYATLTGYTCDGQAIEGRDEITIVPQE